MPRMSEQRPDPRAGQGQRTTEEPSLRDELSSRVRESYDRRNDMGMFKYIFQDGLELPLWEFTQAKHYIDILPYIVGKNHPYLEPGRIHYVLDLWVHYNIGPTRDAFVCMMRSYKEACAVCDYRAAVQAEGVASEKVLKLLQPKRRCIYNIICYDDQKQEDKGIQVWDVAHFFMEKHITELAAERTGGHYPFADLEIGRQITFVRKGAGADNTQVYGHQFLERDYKYPKDFINKTFKLDELIVLPNYDELKEITERGGLPPEPGTKEEPGREGERTERAERSRGPSRRAENPPPPDDQGPLPDDEGTRTETRPAPDESGACPNGFVFGVDIDNKTQCFRCPAETYKACEAEKKRGGSGESRTTRQEESPRTPAGRSSNAGASRSGGIRRR